MDYDPGSARERLEQSVGGSSEGSEDSGSDAPGVRDRFGETEFDADDIETDYAIDIGDEFRTTLLLGSDAREGRESRRADAIMLVVVPPDERQPVIASIPRDRWVPNPCTGGMSRINAGLNGCGDDVSGSELMSIMVEDLAGIEIDHYAEVEFDGFIDIIDAFGGVEICTEHPVRDERAELSLPGGCVTASGEDALAWTRSRETQELVDGRWRRKPGVGVLTRDERQQELALEVADRIAGFESLARLHSVTRGLQGSVTLDEQMTLLRAVLVAWAHRGIDTDEVERISLPVRNHVTSGGAHVLQAEASLDELLAEALEKAPSDLATSG